MAIDDFNKYKPLQVASVSGTPTISKAVPVKITSGESTTGTGEIGIDWTNVLSKADIGIYDESDTLMDYYFESFDAASSSAVVWVYDSWARDGTEQLRVAYGSGPSDQSVSPASIVFSKKTNIEAQYLFNESSGDLLDVSGNSYDGTIDGAAQGATGRVGGAYSFDGTDDGIYLPSFSNNFNDGNSGGWAVSIWAKLNSSQDERLFQFLQDYFGPYHTSGGGDWSFKVYDGISGTTINISSPSTGIWNHFVFLATGDAGTGHLELYKNGSLVGDTTDWSITTASLNNTIGRPAGGSASGEHFDGLIDDVEIHNKPINSDEVSAEYDAEKSSPEFFSQQSPEEPKAGNAIFHGINF